MRDQCTDCRIAADQPERCVIAVEAGPMPTGNIDRISRVELKRDAQVLIDGALPVCRDILVIWGRGPRLNVREVTGSAAATNGTVAGQEAGILISQLRLLRPRSCVAAQSET